MVLQRETSFLPPIGFYPVGRLLPAELKKASGAVNQARRLFDERKAHLLFLFYKFIFHKNGTNAARLEVGTPSSTKDSSTSTNGFRKV